MRQLGLWDEDTILDYFDAAVAQWPNHIAVVEYKSPTGTREALSYAELAARVHRIAFGFVRLGIRPGDVISVQLPNWWEFIAIHLATMRVGAITNPLMPIFRARELPFMLELAESKILIAPRDFREFQYSPMAAEL